MTAVCRGALPADAEGILELKVKGQSSDWPFSIVNREKALARITSLIDESIVVVCVEGDEIVGSIGFDAHEWWFSDDIFLCEVWTLIRADRRESTVPDMLLSRAKLLAEKAGTPMVVGIVSPKQAEQKNKLFRRHFTPVGEIFAHMGA
ncbi:MAG: hypothetical protein OEX14_05845 [Paracoccaceae bacterium]|nr:hypothetical protein [Paracoccaceae bacterium]